MPSRRVERGQRPGGVWAAWPDGAAARGLSSPAPPMRGLSVTPPSMLRVTATPTGTAHSLVVRGAREHNLRDVSVDLPRDSLIVFTGLSGSGKSSLAFDTIFAEGQRRYVESLSAYARQFLGQMDKPDVDFIEGLSPAVSIDQKSTNRNPRSTVGTITEVYDYLRLLFARAGRPHCPVCGEPVTRQSPQQIVDQLLDARGPHPLPGARARRPGPQGRVRRPLRRAADQGLLARPRRRRGRLAHRAARPREAEASTPSRSSSTASWPRATTAAPSAASPTRSRPPSASPAASSSSTSSTATPRTRTASGASPRRWPAPTTTRSAWTRSSRGRSRSTRPFGACPECTGIGTELEVDPELVVPDDDLSLAEGAIAPWAQGSGSAEYFQRVMAALAEDMKFSMDAPFRALPARAKEALLHGQNYKVHVKYKNRYGRDRSYTTGFEGVVPFIKRRHSETDSEWSRERYEGYMREVPCPVCKGARLKPESLAVLLGGKNISEVCGLAINEAAGFLDTVDFTAREKQIAERVIKEIDARLGFLLDVGLDYLSLDRPAGTLSGGEAQRIRLATQIGSGLVGVLYVLDEPSIGLHQRDNHRLIETLTRLRDLGNTLIVVEHDEDTIATADWVVDIGPGAGEHGGHVVHSGTGQGPARAPRLAHRHVPLRPARDPDARRAPRPRRAPDHRDRRPREQPPERLGRLPARQPRRGHRRLRLRQVDARQRHPLQRPRQQAQRRAPRARPAQDGHRARPARQGRPRRPEPDRTHPAIEPRDLHRRLRQHAQALRRDDRGQGARLPAGPVLLQRQGRPLRRVLRRRHDQDRDELPARRLRPVRGVPRGPLQPGDAGGALQGQDDRRRARHADRGGRHVLRGGSRDRAPPQDPQRRRPGLRAPRPAGADPLRW